MSRFTTRRSIRVLATLLLGGVISFPLGVIASDNFADVPDSNTYHNDINAIAEAGVTTGCGNGNYCPSAFVTREQMAAFMNRLGALAVGKTPVVNAAKLGGHTADQFVRSDVPTTRYAGCSGGSMMPADSSWPYTTATQGYDRISAGYGIFTCTVDLPDGATVVAFRAGVFDGHAADHLECGLARVNWASGAGDTMAAPPSTGAAFADGLTILEDTSINVATVDASEFVHVAWCTFSAGSGAGLAVNGVSVEYTAAG